VSPAAVPAVAARMAQIGMKPDVPDNRVSRAVRQVASERGVPEAEVLRLPLIDDVIELLATHESWFFRDPRQLAALAGHVLPPLSGPVHVWCVGCANGQEAWSVAMLLAEARGVDGDWRVTASDLSGRALAVAERGAYPINRLRGLSTDRRLRFVKQAGDEWVITDSLRARVSFVKQNVVTQRPPVQAGSCQVVLCRNVLIYLHEEGARKALESLGQAMESEGWLLVGSAESLWGITDAFDVVRLPGAFAYRRADAPVAPPPKRVAPRAARGPSPSIPPTHELMAMAAAAAAGGRHDDAVRVYRQAAYLDPDLVDAHAGLAASLAAVGDQRGAARARAVVERLRSRR
jgi:chemotaxis methyl-accepting protein methylase